MKKYILTIFGSCLFLQALHGDNSTSDIFSKFESNNPWTVKGALFDIQHSRGITKDEALNNISKIIRLTNHKDISIKLSALNTIGYLFLDKSCMSDGGVSYYIFNIKRYKSNYTKNAVNVVVPLFINFLSDNDSDVVNYSILALTYIGPQAKESLNILNKYLWHSDSDIRYNSIIAVYNIETNKNIKIEQFNKLANDNDKRISNLAKSALEKLK